MLNFSGAYTEIITLNSKIIAAWATGRCGLAFFILGAYTVKVGAQLLIPIDTSGEHPPSASALYPRGSGPSVTWAAQPSWSETFWKRPL